MSMRIWKELPEKYRASEDPEELFTLWRGDKLGKHITGMFCTLGSDIAEQTVYNSLHVKYPALHTLVQRHTLDSFSSPFISLTNNIDIAQRFAQGDTESVYGIVLPAFKLVVDPVGPKAPVGTLPEEYLAIGHIDPGDIIAPNPF